MRNLVVGCLVATVLTSCAGTPEDEVQPTAAGPACVTDLTTPTATLTIANREGTRPSHFLTADAAIVQSSADPAAPQVLGDADPRLQRALEGTRVWAVADPGLLVQTGTGEVALIGADTRTTTLTAPLEAIERFQVIGDRFYVAHGERTAGYELATGAEVDADAPTLGTRVGIASSVALVGDRFLVGVRDLATSTETTFDDLSDQTGLESPADLSVAGVGADRFVLKADEGDGSRYWTWDGTDGLLAAYDSTDPATRSGHATPGTCGDYLYLPEHGELRVIDTRDGTVVSSRELQVEDITGGADVLAVPGGVLLVESLGTSEFRRYAWYDG